MLNRSAVVQYRAARTSTDVNSSTDEMHYAETLPVDHSAKPHQEHLITCHDGMRRDRCRHDGHRERPDNGRRERPGRDDARSIFTGGATL